MFAQEPVSELLTGLTPFPKDVFVPEQQWLYNDLLPLLSIDLGILQDDLRGTIVHMLNPVEPYDGCMGDETTDYHNQFTGANWLAFELTPDNQYRFLGNQSYFLSAPIHAEYIKDHSDYIEHVKSMHDSYTQSKLNHEKYGKLVSIYDGEINEQDYLERLGGEFLYANWCHETPPSAFKMTHDDSTEKLVNDGISISYQGNEFMYVAEVAGYNWCEAGADAILLFYEPQSRIVLFTYDWT